MAPSKIRKALGAVKDHTSIGIAKVSTSNHSLSDLDVAIVKATRHDEYPGEEKHIREILSLTCYSRVYISQCVATLSRRLGRTRSWAVALKTLILVHRLLIDGDPTYEQEIFFATRRGTRMLNLSDFRDTSRSDAWDYSAFVRTYARYLDEMLEYRMHGRRGRRRSRSQQLHEELTGMSDDGGSRKSDNSQALTEVLTPVREMRTEKVFTRTQHLQQLLERFLACRPTGSAKDHRIVAVALYPVLKESFQLYVELQEVMAIFVDRFMDVQVRDCVRIHGIFSRLAKQFDDLDHFYAWCKTAGIARPSEYPDVERITQEKLEVMDEFIRNRADLASRKVKSFEELAYEDDAMREEDAAAPPSQVKALPAPEAVEEPQVKQEEEPTVEQEVEQPLAIVKVEYEEVDFLNLGADAVAVEDDADKLALALFDGQMATTTSVVSSPWEAFGDDTADWETALVQSASNLSGQRATLGGGFDMLLLNGMYGQSRQPCTLGFADGSGSASSVALPSRGSTPMLALPAPPMANGAAVGEDPFAASLSVPAPSYVQMTEMEKKQQLLMEEQVMWQQYARDGMQGQVSIAKMQQAQAAGWMMHYDHHQQLQQHPMGFGGPAGYVNQGF